jgi:hypothetical protein
MTSEAAGIETLFWSEMTREQAFDEATGELGKSFIGQKPTGENHWNL